MAHTPFVFSSVNLPRLKAKLLHKTFPFLSLSVAQEATARALGYSSWYACTHQGTRGVPSLSDQVAGLSTRVWRYYHQANVLIGLGLTPSDADLWVRAWGLTGRPTLAREYAVPLYYRWNDTLEQLDRGEISEDQAIELWASGSGKYPEIERPVRVCPGVILGPCGKYPHYAVDPAINASIPMYFRGPFSQYHYEDDGDVLALTVEGFPVRERHRRKFFDRLNQIQHEWHYGVKHPNSKELIIPQLVTAALSSPDSMVQISQRAMPSLERGFEFGQYAVACLRGRDFASLLMSKGALDSAKVVWYHNIPPRALNNNWIGLGQCDFGEWPDDHLLPIFVNADKHHPSFPLYSYPFMKAPLHSHEYSGALEDVCLLPLDQDYESDEDDEDDDSDDDNDPRGPNPTLLEAMHN